MAIRPAFITRDGFVEKIDIEFDFSNGFSVSQKQKSIKSFHEQISSRFEIPFENILEVSTKSENGLGVKLSAFNLKTKTQKKGKEYSVESAYQSSKVFEKGGPYIDLLNTDSKSAKTDSRLKNSGKLLYFMFYSNRFEINTETAFYDWLYINVLLKNTLLCEEIIKYKAFTDIEFNPKKSINCQAFSIALFVSLKLAGIDMSLFKDPEVFLKETEKFYNKIF